MGLWFGVGSEPEQYSPQGLVLSGLVLAAGTVHADRLSCMGASDLMPVDISVKSRRIVFFSII